MHFAEPPNHSYGFDERPNLVRIIFDTHNFTFPEERRRMRKIVDLFYDYEAYRRQVAHLVGALEETGRGEELAGFGLGSHDLEKNWWRDWAPEPVEVWPPADDQLGAGTDRRGESLGKHNGDRDL
jgi:hypothetical protein